LKENGKTRRVPKAEAIVKQLINNALGADVKSTIIVLDEMRCLEALADEQHGAAPAIRRPEEATLQSISRRIRLMEGARDAGNVGTKPSRRADDASCLPTMGSYNDRGTEPDPAAIWRASSERSFYELHPGQSLELAAHIAITDYHRHCDIQSQTRSCFV